MRCIVSYDVMILSVGAKYKSDISSGNIIAQKLNGFGYAFNKNYAFAGKMKGTWFELLKKDSLPILGSFDLCDFEFEDEHKLFWRLTTQQTDHYSLFFKCNVFLSDFNEIAKEIQNLSPYKMIIFLSRLQGSEMNDICGVITLKEFLELVKKGKVYSNICYIIQDK